MARSVATLPNAHRTVYLSLDLETPDDFGFFVEELQFLAKSALETLTPTDGWVGQEVHKIAEDDRIIVTVSEYCGLISVCIGPCPEVSHTEEDEERCIEHADTIADEIETAFAAGVLRPVGRASNGEQFFRRAETGNTVTSKEGDLGF